MTNRMRSRVIDYVFSLLYLALLTVGVHGLWNNVLAPRFGLGALKMCEALALLIVTSAPMIFARAMITNTKE